MPESNIAFGYFGFVNSTTLKTKSLVLTKLAVVFLSGVFIFFLIRAYCFFYETFYKMKCLFFFVIAPVCYNNTTIKYLYH